MFRAGVFRLSFLYFITVYIKFPIIYYAVILICYDIYPKKSRALLKRHGARFITYFIKLKVKKSDIFFFVDCGKEQIQTRSHILPEHKIIENLKEFLLTRHIFLFGKSRVVNYGI